MLPETDSFGFALGFIVSAAFVGVGLGVVLGTVDDFTVVGSIDVVTIVVEVVSSIISETVVDFSVTATFNVPSVFSCTSFLRMLSVISDPFTRGAPDESELFETDPFSLVKLDNFR